MIKAVITAAGKGTRLLPITKEIPKEMLPIFSKKFGKKRILIPMTQFIFEQLYASSIRDFCFVVGREKRSIEDHFTEDVAYLKNLSRENQFLISDFYNKLEHSQIMWVNQNKPLGFGDAVRKVEKFIGNDDFVVHAGDVSIISKKKHPITRLMKIAKNDHAISAILLCKKVKDVKKYGVPKVTKISENLFEVKEVEEKPVKPKSNFGLLPIYFFKPEIFDCLKKIKRGRDNEYQLTDAIQLLIEKGKKVVAIPLMKNEVEIDVGTVQSYKEALENSYKMG